MSNLIDTVLLISISTEDKGNSNVIGTGGWLPHQEREALDWMVLVKFMGWRVVLISLKEFKQELVVQLNIKWIIFAGDSDEIPGDNWDQIFKTVIANKIMFISQAGRTDGQFSKHAGIHISDKVQSGRLLRWKDLCQERNWECRNDIQIPTLYWQNDFYASATLTGEAIIATKRIGFGKLVVLSFHPSEARDQSGAFTALLKHLLIYGSLVPVAWYDWKNTVILRMDDPGSMEVVYNNRYHDTKIYEHEWSIIGDELKQRNARMSIGYVPGWVDDGDQKRGELFIKGKRAPRAKGNVHPSPIVKYLATNYANNNIIYDYEAEFRGIQKLRKRGLVDVELHGYTHLNPDRNSWAKATDRYSNTSWYREFDLKSVKFLKSNPDIEHPLKTGLKLLSSYFVTFPSTLICPGDEFTNETVERALKAGLTMISSYYLAVKIGADMCWATHVCAPYLDKADPLWFDSELPIVGYFHDFDIKSNGTSWLSTCLKAWEAAGAKHFINFREVAGKLSRYISIKKNDRSLTLSVEVINSHPLIEPTPVNIFDPDEKLETTIKIKNDEEEYLIRH